MAFDKSRLTKLNKAILSLEADMPSAGKRYGFAHHSGLADAERERLAAEYPGDEIVIFTWQEPSDVSAASTA